MVIAIPNLFFLLAILLGGGLLAALLVLFMFIKLLHRSAS
jgi:hypothetical protein